ncbi:MAG: hypothetical protein V1772_01955 [Chloroflexota bacterium]
MSSWSASLPDLSDWLPGEMGAVRRGGPEVRQAEQALLAILCELGFEPESVGPDWWEVTQQDSPLWIGSVTNLPDAAALAVAMPLIEPPGHPLLRLDLYDDLLEFNRYAVGSFRASVIGRVAMLSAMHPLDDVTREVVEQCLRVHETTAVPLGEALRRGYNLHLPDIDLDDDEWYALFDLMRACEPPAQRLFSQVLEVWMTFDGLVEITDRRVNLRAPTARETIVGRLDPRTARGPAVILGWDALVKVDELTSAGLAAFKAMLPRPPGARVTGAMIHYPCDVSLGQRVEDALLDAVEFLADTLSAWPTAQEWAAPPAEERPETRPALTDVVPPSAAARATSGLLAPWLEGLDLAPETQHALDRLDQACHPAPQAALRSLVRGWSEAGHPLAVEPNRMAILQVRVGAETLPLLAFVPPNRRRPAHVDWVYAHALGRPAAAMRAFREAMTAREDLIPDDEPHHLDVSDDWAEPHTQAVLEATLALAAAMQAAPPATETDQASPPKAGGVERRPS